MNTDLLILLKTYIRILKIPPKIPLKYPKKGVFLDDCTIILSQDDEKCSKLWKITHFWETCFLGDVEKSHFLRVFVTFLFLGLIFRDVFKKTHKNRHRIMV